MKALTAAEMREVDRLTSERHGVASLTLMENAGARIAEFIQEKFPNLARRRIVVLCGKGNNGGDGFVVARRLRGLGAQPAVYLFASPEEMRGDAAVNRARWRDCGGELHCAGSASELAEAKRAIATSEIIADALLGTGARGPAEGNLREAIEGVNGRKRGQIVVAVDIPSGASADTGDLPGAAVQADYTVTLTAPKIGMFYGRANECCGNLLVRDIGSPPELIEEAGKGDVRWIEPRELAEFAIPRRPQGHKGDYGHALIVAGSVGKSGAAALASRAALRAGAGLVTAATPEPVLPAVAAYTPEVMTEPLAATKMGSIALRNLEGGYFDALRKGKRALGIGPGLTTQAETAEFVREIVRERNVPIILDADGLNAFAGRAAELRSARGNLALTPHPGEMARLAGCGTDDVQRRRIEVAQKAAADWNCHVVLKGHQTVVAAPDGRIGVNSTGNPGMATGGTGDVLTGILAGLTAQYGAERWLSVLSFGVYLHGLAGDLAAKETGEAGLIASDLIQFLPCAYQHFQSELDRA